MEKPPLKRRRWVVKVGSSLLTANGRGLDQDIIAAWAAQIAALRAQGIEIVMVSSGAVAEGMVRLNWNKRPAALHELQAAAAVGQMGLIQAWESHFQRHKLHTAQILLTHDDLAHRQRYLNARSTLWTLLQLGVIPVVNENDTVATDEIKFGDNDTLAALVANLVEADLLIILTDQEGLFDKDPRKFPDAKLIPEVQAGDPQLEEWAAGSPGELGRGGMLTKVRAAKRAAASGAATVIAAGRAPAVLQKLADGAGLGTLLRPAQNRVVARKQWLASHLQVKGKVTLDVGATKVILEGGKSLLPVGVAHVEGNFQRGEVVACVSHDGKEIARGLVNYTADETRRIMRQPSTKILEILGYVDEPELIHRDNLVLI
ncbi:MAG: glutamate 5-kinase [Gammaproteobacteria bacterium]|nr:glutamate 5-kinase [Gammaproteobacteria bacterium]